MQILNSFSHYAIPLFRETILPAISEQQKKIMTLAAIAFGALALCYVIIRRNKENRTIEFVDKVAELKYLPKKLESLLILSCPELSDEHIEQLPRNLKKLNIVDICEHLTDACIKDLPQDLEELYVSNHFNDAAMKDLPKTLTKLRLGGNKLTDDAIKDLPPELQELQLIDCNQLTEAALKNLPKNINNVYLKISKDSKLNNVSIKDFPESVRKIEINLTE